MAVAGYQLRVNGGALAVDTIINVGNVLTYDLTGLDANTTYNVEVRAYDGAGNYSAWSAVVQGTTDGPLLDAFSTTHLGVWSLTKERTAYAGGAVRVRRAADSVETDIGFDANGDVDIAAYSAYGTGTEPVIRIYDQSGNGWHLDIDAAVGCILRTSTYNSKPCWYMPNGTGAITGTWTDWNGLADVNFISVQKPITLDNGQLWNGSIGGHVGYQVGGNANRYVAFNQWFGPVSADFHQVISYGGMVQRYQYDGGGATDADRLRFYKNGTERTAASRTGSPAATWEAETGLRFNGVPLSTEYLDTEHFAFYYFGYQLSGPEETTLNSRLGSRYFTFTDSQIVFEGDSQTAGSFLATTIPNRVDALLQTETGTTWTTSNVALPGATFAVNILSERNIQVDILRDEWKVNDIAVLWAGTNDLHAGGTGAQALTDTTTWVTAVKARGFDVYVGTMLPRQDVGVDPGYETERAAYNSGLAAAVSGLATVIDIAAIPELADPTNLTYYNADKVHITEASAALIAQEVFDVIQPNLN